MTNEEKIVALRGKHRDASVLILGNGPSLRRNDFSTVSSDVTLFGINRSWTKVRAHYHAISDRVHMREIHDRLWAPNFLFSGLPPAAWPAKTQGVRFATTEFRDVGGRLSPVFSLDLRDGVAMGGTPFVAMQIAAWMGFSKMFLAGIDLEVDPETGSGHHYPGQGIPKQMCDEQTWNFGIAKEALDRLTVRVVNLNPRSRLKIWPRVPFEEMFK